MMLGRLRKKLVDRVEQDVHQFRKYLGTYFQNKILTKGTNGVYPIDPMNWSYIWIHNLEDLRESLFVRKIPPECKARLAEKHSSHAS